MLITTMAIQFLERGGQLAQKKADKSSEEDSSSSRGRNRDDDGHDDHDHAATISLHQLINEIHKRIQTNYVISSIIAGIGVKYIAYQKPQVTDCAPGRPSKQFSPPVPSIVLPFSTRERRGSGKPNGGIPR
jgi:hypothetical protein